MADPTPLPRPPERTGLPRTTTAGASTAGAALAYLLTENLGSGLPMQVAVFAVVAALGLLVPSLRHPVDPTVPRSNPTDISASSIILSLAYAVAAAYAAGDLPVPDEMRGLFVALIAAVSGTHVPSVAGSLPGGRHLKPPAG